MKIRTFKKIGRKKELIVNLLVMFLIFAFLLSYFKPELMLSETTTTGGDTPSHHYIVQYLRDYLLPEGKIIGWSPGWYAGFPLFQFYFPLPYILMALLSYIIPFLIAFKLITVFGVFLLPVCAFFSFKIMDFKFPLPAIAAIFTLPFLFLEAYSMYGGNIPSTLAGEFQQSLSMSLMVLSFGLLYKGIRTKKYTVKNAVLISLVALSHIFPLIVEAISSIFFLFSKRLLENFRYLLKVFLLAFMLLGFWIVPFFLKTGFSTSYNWSQVRDIGLLFPGALIPFYILTIFGVYRCIRSRDSRIGFFLFSILVSALLFLILPDGQIWNVRFLPTVHLFSLLVAAYALSEMVKKLKPGITFLAPIATLVAMLIIVSSSVTYIPFWIEWNYEGFENKAEWNTLSGIMDYLNSLPDGRVMHEYSDTHNKFGSPRTFESIPYFTGKPVMEGLLIDSALSATFHFMTQPEISEKSSCPLRGVPCLPFDVEKATEHMKLWNIRYVVATSDKLKNALRNNGNYTFLKGFDDIEIWQLEGDYHYVTVPRYEPILVKTDSWKQISIDWFQSDFLDVPLVFVNKIDEYDRENFNLVFETNNFGDIDIEKTEMQNNCTVDETIKNEEILIKTSCVGKPHLVKVSYFPNWQADGAKRVYLASPSLMMIIPEQENVRLYYGLTTADIIGCALSILAIIIIIFYFIPKTRSYFQRFDKRVEKISVFKKMPSPKLPIKWKKNLNSKLDNLEKSLKFDKLYKILGFRFLLFLSAFLIFFSFASFEMNGPNPGGRFMLTKSIVLYHKPDTEKSDFERYNGMDYALKDGKYYSDKPPGLSFLVASFYAFGYFLHNTGIELPSPSGYYFPGDGNAMFFITLFLCVITALAVVRVYDTAKFFFSKRSSLFAALIFGFGTIFFIYSSTLFSHAVTAFLLISAFYHLINFKKGSRRDIFYAGVFLGFALTVEYPVILTLPFFALYLFFEESRSRLRNLKIKSIFFLPLVMFLLIFGAYNWIAFGNPLSTTYEFSSFKDSMNFNHPLLDGLYVVLISSWRGIFFYSPILLLSLIGFFFIIKKYKAETLLFLSIILVYVVLFSKYSYFWGGLCFGSRHLVAVLPFLVLLAMPLFEKEYRKKFLKIIHINEKILSFLIIILIFISFFHSFLGAYVSPLPYPELNNNPIYEITLPEFLQGKQNSFWLKNYPFVFWIFVFASLLIMLSLYRKLNEK